MHASQGVAATRMHAEQGVAATRMHASQGVAATRMHASQGPPNSSNDLCLFFCINPSSVDTIFCATVWTPC